MKTRRQGWVVAMDGPAGVGKSTIGQLVANRLGYHFMNTGEMYRAVTWKALKEKIDLTDSRAVARLTRRLRWEFKPIEGGVTLRVFIDGDGLTSQIRDEKVSKNVSTVAAIPAVRRLLRHLQRQLGKNGEIVMEGRDITTHVFPDAEIKIFLDASLEERAARRCRQLKSAGRRVSLDRIKTGISTRDRSDQQFGYFSQAKDAIVIDATHLTQHEVANRILKHIRAKRNGHS